MTMMMMMTTTKKNRRHRKAARRWWMWFPWRKFSFRRPKKWKPNPAKQLKAWRHSARWEGEEEVLFPSAEEVEAKSRKAAKGLETLCSLGGGGGSSLSVGRRSGSQIPQSS